MVHGGCCRLKLAPVYVPPPLKTPVEAFVLELAKLARDGKLVVCAGAGLSIADDAGLPSGRRLGELLDTRLTARMAGYASPGDVGNLIAVADAGEGPAGSADALQDEVLELAQFLSARPNYGHQALALLLAEGAVTALSWNWDTCIERATPAEERIEVARTEDDITYLDRAQLTKVHGCASMPRSLLVTSEHLKRPQPWADAAFALRLSTSTVAFVGIGDVADYAKQRITELFSTVRPPEIVVVSPSIKSNWEQSVWSRVVPRLDEARRVEQSADVFLDELGRAWAGELTGRVSTRKAALLASVHPGVDRVLEALGALSSVAAIRWYRRLVMTPRMGESVVLSAATPDAVIAIGVLASRTQKAVRAVRPACCAVGERQVDVLVAEENATAQEIEREALRRSEALRSNGQVEAEDRPEFLIVGTVLGTLDRSDESAPRDVAGDKEEDALDLVDGPRTVLPRYLDATPLLREAA